MPIKNNDEPLPLGGKLKVKKLNKRIAFMMAGMMAVATLPTNVLADLNPLSVDAYQLDRTGGEPEVPEVPNSDIVDFIENELEGLQVVTLPGQVANPNTVRDAILRVIREEFPTVTGLGVDVASITLVSDNENMRFNSIYTVEFEVTRDGVVIFTGEMDIEFVEGNAPALIPNGRFEAWRINGTQPNLAAGDIYPVGGASIEGQIHSTSAREVIESMFATGQNFQIEISLENASFPTQSEWNAEAPAGSPLALQRANWNMAFGTNGQATAISANPDGQFGGSGITIVPNGSTAAIRFDVSGWNTAGNTGDNNEGNPNRGHQTITPRNFTLPIISTNGEQIVLNTLSVSHNVANGGSLVLSNATLGSSINTVSNTMTGAEWVSFDLSVREAQRRFFGTQGPSSANNQREAGETNFELRAPSGFRWVNPNTVVTTGTSQNVDGRPTFNLQNNDTILEVYANVTPNDNFDSVIRLNGLRLEAINVANPPQGEVEIDIRNISRSSAPSRGDWVTSQTIVAGVISDFDVTLTRVGAHKEEAPEVVSGRLETEVARVRVEENMVGAINERLSFSLDLPEGVNLYSAEVVNRQGIAAGNLSQGTTVYNTNERNNNMVINGNRLIISDVNRASTTTTTRMAFELDLVLSVDPTFEGDIDLVLGGRAAANANENSVTLAESIAPVTVTSNTTDLRVGYQFLPVANFTITENVAGALERGEEVWVSVTDGIFTEFAIAGGFDWDVTEGDLEVANVRVVNETSLTMGGVLPQLRFEVAADSRHASTIEFSNVQVRQLFNAPQSNRGYDLLVWGPAVANNASHVGLINAAFEADGIVANTNGSNSVITANAWNNLPSRTADTTTGVGFSRENVINPRNLHNNLGVSTAFITAEVPGSTAGTPVVNSTVTFDANGVVTVDGTVRTANAEEFGAPSIINDALFVPARLAFSIFFEGANPMDPELFIWDTATSTFTVDPSGRNIRITTGSTVMHVGGEVRQILAGEGDTARAVAAMVDLNNNSRMMIPARTFAEVLGFSVNWDASTGTATFTPNNN